MRFVRVKRFVDMFMCKGLACLLVVFGGFPGFWSTLRKNRVFERNRTKIYLKNFL